MACASATDQNMLESDDRIVVYIGGSSEAAHKSEPRTNFSEKYEREVAEPGRSIRAVTSDNSSERFGQNTSSGAFYFDYLVKDPQGKLHFHIQQKFENGTVVGIYGHGGDFDRYLIVNYVADAKGYRATNSFLQNCNGSSFTEESDHSKLVGLKAYRSSGKVLFGVWGIESNVHKLYTPRKDLKSDEDEDSERNENQV
ncbi:hypothetical protein AVEN_14915-1 [Araneus ventricosus]|uniref:Uncharacterized protein n=1 Tax=Araneus ventricosus TaxID=182803 RepID=A0A4Y2JNU1_ARAVE|nr:hypothetical protein AVEN_14915-1 [Araneus ventricosus]